MKKSHSLPRKLPSNDPILTAALAHRGAAKQYDEGTDSPDLQTERQQNSSMQLILPDMPQIANHDDYSNSRMANSHEQHPTVSNHCDNSRSLDQQRSGPSYDTSRSHDEYGRPELKSSSSSRLSKSSRSSNLSQDDDDMDGSLLDLADELGDEEGELGTQQSPTTSVSIIIPPPPHTRVEYYNPPRL